MQLPLSNAEIARIDAFISGAKILRDPEPEWQKSSRPRDREAIWIVEEQDGSINAHLRFRFVHPEHPSISVIYAGNPIWRIDMTDPSTKKSNPHDAWRIGLDADVVGSHEHCWKDNKQWVQKNGFIGLPYRRVLHPKIRRLPQMLADLGSKINLTLTTNQRSFDVPPQGELRYTK